MPLTVRRILGSSSSLGIEPPVVTQTPQGWSAVDYWVVDTSDVVAAVSAAGAPRVGLAFDALPGVVGLKCVKVDARVVGGVPSATAGEPGGVTVFRCEYSTPGGGTGAGGNGNNAGEPEPGLGVKYSAIGFRSGTVQQYSYNTDPVPGEPEDPEWNNGRGIPVEVGSVELVVTTHHKPEAWTLQVMPRVVALATARAINDAVVRLPGFVGSEQYTLDFTPGQLRYGGASVESVRSVEGEALLRVRHAIDAAPDFKVRWRNVDYLGRPYGAVSYVTPYPAMDFGGVL